MEMAKNTGDRAKAKREILQLRRLETLTDVVYGIVIQRTKAEDNPADHRISSIPPYAFSGLGRPARAFTFQSKK